MVVPAVMQQPQLPMMTAASEAFAKDAIIAWFRGEFAAANAVIDALCSHLTQLEGGDAAAYESAFAAIHRRRLNWIPILQMQKYYSIGDVTVELKKVVEKKRSENEVETEKIEEVADGGCAVAINEKEMQREKDHESSLVSNENGGGEVVDEDFSSEITDSGETFILYNQQTKGNKRELIQLGVPIFGQVKEDDTNTCQRSNNEPIPALLRGVIDHLIQWRLIPESRRPNSCIINFFDEGEYSQPFLKPPHLEQPLSTLLLSESTMAFGRMLVSDGEGNYRGPLMLSLKQGAYLVMRGNSSDTARHVMCSSANKRVSITFFRVREERESSGSEITAKAMTLWQPGVPTPQTMPNNYTPMNVIPKWGLLRAPLVMLAPMRPVVVNHPRKIQRGGTGVFLPWNGGSRRHAKHLPPRAQRGRFLALPPPVEGDEGEKNS